MSLRNEFVLLAQQEGCNISSLCKRFNISRKTGYKLLNRFREIGPEGLVDLSRRPHSSPSKTPDDIEAALTSLRKEHPAWGGRKLKRRLEDLGYQDVPVPSTITEILRRNQLLDAAESLKHKPFIRFEHPEPNDLWQMDFKGDFQIRQGRCHPLTVIDDHSRYSIILKACADERTNTVQQALIDAFRNFGLPRRITMDNGSPWGDDQYNQLTPLTVWMIRLGIRASHSRPYHPQTQGKDERFHRTLKAEAITGHEFSDLRDCQQRFDHFRDTYNLERPHDSLNLDTPVTRYRPSQRPYPETLPPIEYGPDDQVRKVQAGGEIWIRGKAYRVPRALRGNSVALRPTGVDGVLSVFFCNQKVKEISLHL